MYLDMEAYKVAITNPGRLVEKKILAFPIGKRARDLYNLKIEHRRVLTDDEKFDSLFTEDPKLTRAIMKAS
ncbi:MAG: hypothetical protein DRJ03_27150 [Chloroflexi bacterium]|nr:MAG: hypothetical protein DRJ03_27150 [Chloroflexota bacterium]